MPYILRNQVTKEVHLKMYATEKNARSGKRNLVDDCLIEEYLHNGKYQTYLHYYHYAPKKNTIAYEEFISKYSIDLSKYNIPELLKAKERIELDWTIIFVSFDDESYPTL